MGCLRRSHYDDIRPEQKWEFISLNDFKSKSCFTYIAYGYLWLSLGISCAVYGVDTFTAVNLLAFDRWTSIDPTIPIKITKWIFSGCIILSWLNLGYEHFRAWRVIKRGAVAESYLDSLAVRLQSVRMGTNGRGWRRFLVFAELTKSKKGAEYVALFTYFSFQSWIRVIFCSGPRQVVNALTLYSVLQKNLTDTSGKSAGNAILQFFKNIGAMAETNHEQAIILSSMLFTFVIWIFAALSLILALLFYVFFLWHYIPNSDGGLSSYCERKINRRLTKIVSVKVNKALEDEERRRQKALYKATKKGEKPPAILGRQATLPTLYDPKDEEDMLPQMPTLHRNDTTTTLPLYSSRPGTPSSQMPALPDLELRNLDQRRPFPTRTGTSSSAMSNTSYASNAPLMAGAADMGYGRSASPAPSRPPLDANGYPMHRRTNTGSSGGSGHSQVTVGPAPSMRYGTPGPIRRPTQDERSTTPIGLSRQLTQDSFFPGPLPRQRTQDSLQAEPTLPFATQLPVGRSASPGPRAPPFDPYGRPVRRDTHDGPTSAVSAGRSSPVVEMPEPTLPVLLDGGSKDAVGMPEPTVPDMASVGPVVEMPEPTIPNLMDVGRTGGPAVEMPVPDMSMAIAEMPGSEAGRSNPAPTFPFGAQTGRNSPAPISPFGSQNGRDSPAPFPANLQNGRNTSAPNMALMNGTQPAPASLPRSGYIAYNPNHMNRSASAAISNTGPSYPPAQPRLQRNMTEPIQPQPFDGDYFGDGLGMPPRVGTPQSMRSNYGGQPQAGYNANAPSAPAGPPRTGSAVSSFSRPGPGPVRGPPPSSQDNYWR